MSSAVRVASARRKQQPEEKTGESTTVSLGDATKSQPTGDAAAPSPRPEKGDKTTHSQAQTSRNETQPQAAAAQEQTTDSNALPPSDQAEIESQDDDEDLVKVIQRLKAAQQSHSLASNQSNASQASTGQATDTKQSQASLQIQPTPVDEIKQWLASARLGKTIICLAEEVRARPADAPPLPEWQDTQSSSATADSKDEKLSEEESMKLIKTLRAELAESVETSQLAKAAYASLVTQRDYHRMHHRRVLQEKALLLRDLQRMTTRYKEVDSLVDALKAKVDQQAKRQMAQQIRTQRLRIRLATATGVEEPDSSDEAQQQASSKLMSPTASSNAQSVRASSSQQDAKQQAYKLSGTMPRKPQQSPNSAAAAKKKQLNSNAAGSPSSSQDLSATLKRDTPLPTALTPLASQQGATAAAAVNWSALRCTTTIAAHQQPITSLALHPKRPDALVACSSDDSTWTLHSLQSSQLVMTGIGHTSWVGACAFTPDGESVLTCSGDHSVKQWSLSSAAITQTWSDLHTQAIWSLAVHESGNFFATASADGSAKVIDRSSLRVRFAMRGHVDSVNRVAFVPQTLTQVCTASSDKTLQLWDLRQSNASSTSTASVQNTATLYGHHNSISALVCSNDGVHLWSGDADGLIKHWDRRTNAELYSINTNLHCAGKESKQAKQVQSVNDLTIDLLSKHIIAASEDGLVKIYSAASGEPVVQLVGHSDSVQSVRINNANGQVVTGASDGTIKVWA